MKLFGFVKQTDIPLNSSDDFSKSEAAYFYLVIFKKKNSPAPLLKTFTNF